MHQITNNKRNENQNILNFSPQMKQIGENFGDVKRKKNQQQFF